MKILDLLSLVLILCAGQTAADVYECAKIAESVSKSSIPGSHAKAAGQFRQCAKEAAESDDPEESSLVGQLHYNAGYSLQLGGDEGGALQGFEDAIRSGAPPQIMKQAHLKSAFIYARMDSYGSALHHIDQASHYSPPGSPPDPELPMRAGDMLVNQKRFSDGIARYGQSLAALRAQALAVATSKKHVLPAADTGREAAKSNGAPLGLSHDGLLDQVRDHGLRSRLAALEADVRLRLGDAYSNLKRGASAMRNLDLGLALAPEHPQLLASAWHASLRTGGHRTSSEGLAGRAVGAMRAEIKAGRPSPLSPYQLQFMDLRGLGGGGTAGSLGLVLGGKKQLAPAYSRGEGLRRLASGSWLLQHIRTARGQAKLLEGALMKMKMKMHISPMPGQHQERAIEAGVDPLSIAVVSRRFEEYPGTQLLLGLLKAWAADPRVRLACFGTGRDDGSWERQAVMSRCSAFEDLSNLPGYEQAARVAAIGASVVLDYDGLHDFTNAPVLASGPGHVQVTFLGYAGPASGPVRNRRVVREAGGVAHGAKHSLRAGRRACDALDRDSFLGDAHEDQVGVDGVNPSVSRASFSNPLKSVVRAIRSSAGLPFDWQVGDPVMMPPDWIATQLWSEGIAVTRHAKGTNGTDSMHHNPGTGHGPDEGAAASDVYTEPTVVLDTVRGAKAPRPTDDGPRLMLMRGTYQPQSVEQEHLAPLMMALCKGHLNTPTLPSEAPDTVTTNTMSRFAAALRSGLSGGIDQGSKVTEEETSSRGRLFKGVLFHRWMAARRAAREVYLPGVPADAPVYAAFNRLEKIDGMVVDAWAGLLRIHPQARLWIFNSSSEGTEALRAAMQARGVQSHRVVAGARLPKGEHLLRHVAADAFLDSRTYGAHTSASDALTSGLPVITVPGAGAASRVGAGLVRAAGVPWLAAGSHRNAMHLADRLGRMQTVAGIAMRRRALTRSALQCHDTSGSELGQPPAAVHLGGQGAPLFDPVSFAGALGRKLRAARELAALECGALDGARVNWRAIV